MKITRREDAIAVDKGNGTSVRYYIYPEYEIHYNEILAGTFQQWHHHEVIEETLYIITGALEAHWRDAEGNSQFDKLGPGDVIRVGSLPHTFANTSESTATFMVVRTVPDGRDKREIIKNDKVLDEPYSA